MDRLPAILLAAVAIVLTVVLAIVATAATAQPFRDPDIRGLKLGVKLDDVRGLFQGEVAEWKQDWRPEDAHDPLLRRSLEIRLADRAGVKLQFTSLINGRQAQVIVYEQLFREGAGPAWLELKAQIEAKYGTPDKEIFRDGSTAYRSTYDLTSQAIGPLGAFLKVYFDFDRATGRVQTFRLVLNDASLGSQDERQVAEARRENARRVHEGRQTGGPARF